VLIKIAVAAHPFFVRDNCGRQEYIWPCQENSDYHRTSVRTRVPCANQLIVRVLYQWLTTANKSFRRKPESRQGSEFLWIPAFAGMTGKTG